MYNDTDSHAQANAAFVTCKSASVHDYHQFRIEDVCDRKSVGKEIIILRLNVFG